jgi:hypothetical protein
VLDALGLGASASAVHALDLLIVVQKGSEQVLEEYSRLLWLKHLQYQGLIAEGSCVAGVRMKHSDRVTNETVDVTDCLGGDIGAWLVVCRLEVGKITLQEQVNVMVLAWDDLQTLLSLAIKENMEKVSQQLAVGNKLDGFWDY